MRVTVATPPPPFVSLVEAKDQARSSGNEDALMQVYVNAVCQHLDGPRGCLGRAIGVQTLVAHLGSDDNPDRVRLPFPPAIQITTVERQVGGAWSTIDPVEYDFAPDEDRPMLSAINAGWLAGSSACRITYTAGYDVIPAALKGAALLMIADMYANRETVVVGSTASSIPMSVTVANLLQSFRVFR